CLATRIAVFVCSYSSSGSPRAFPYTSLFRSEEQLAFWKAALGGLPEELELPADRPRPTVPTHRGGTVAFRVDAELHAAVAALARDRKSTRLNSSHVKISYVVFCLKKKTATCY